MWSPPCCDGYAAGASPLRAGWCGGAAGRRPLGIGRLFATGDASDDIAGLLRRAEWVGLGVGEHELDRRALFDAAAHDRPHHHTESRAARPDLYAEHFARPLFVAGRGAARLARTPTWTSPALNENSCLAQILDRHEARYWQRADTRLGARPGPRRPTVAVALMATAGLPSDNADVRLVRMVPTLADASTRERVASVVRWLREPLRHQRGPGTRPARRSPHRPHPHQTNRLLAAAVLASPSTTTNRSRTAGPQPARLPIASPARRADGDALRPPPDPISPPTRTTPHTGSGGRTHPRRHGRRNR